MKINDILIEQMLEEEPVMSSWIEDLSLHGNDVEMELNSGRAYIINRVGEDLFDDWINARSKGKFWHSDIRDNYYVSRIR